MAAVDNQSAQIRIVKKKIVHGGHHGGAWKVAYADFVTAMMAFFLVMWITGLSQDVKQAVSGYFKDPVAFMEAAKAGKAPFKVAEPKGGGEVKLMATAAAELKTLEQAKKTIEKIISESPEFKSIKKYIDIKIVDEGLRIDLLEAKESLFFDSASAQVKPSTRSLLARVAAEIKHLPNKLIIEGHTDSLPLARTDGYTNWELSADRANSARQVIESNGLPDKRIAQVRGYAATQPRNPQHPEHFSNRRVSIIVVMTNAMKHQQFGSSESIITKGIKPAVQPAPAFEKPTFTKSH